MFLSVILLPYWNIFSWLYISVVEMNVTFAKTERILTKYVSGLDLNLLLDLKRHPEFNPPQLL